MADRIKFGFWIGEAEDGTFCVYSDHEPVFCLFASTEDEAKATAEKVYGDYARRFKNARARVTARPSHLPEKRIVKSRSYELEEVV